MSEIFDVVVCGGGITGAGVARDAALRGLRVALLEKADLASGTSSRSSKLVHGGLRYLEQGHLKLVFEGTSERLLQMRRAPHLVRPVPFLVPIYKRHKPGLTVVDMGLWVYDALAMFRSPKLHRTYRPKKVATMEPALSLDTLAGAIEYYDCLTDDARLTVENAIDAQKLGAEVRTYTEVTGFGRGADGKIESVRARDAMTGQALELRTRAAIVAAGPWTDKLLGQVGLPFPRPVLRPTKGIHVVVDRTRLPVTRAVTMFTSDGRVMFTLPWIERTVIGTTDTDFAGDPDSVHAAGADVDYLLRHTNEFFPEARLTRDDVLATWAGLRPLIAVDPDARASDVSREHEVFVLEPGVIVIAGGKLTTYRRMAKETLDQAVQWIERNRPEAFEGRSVAACRTKHRPLPGAAGLDPGGSRGVAAVAERLRELGKLSPRTATHLAETYGSRAETVLLRALSEPALLERIDPELPYIWAEVDHAIDSDFARTVEDVLARRIPLALRSRDQGLGAAERVAERMSHRLSWASDERARQVEAYGAFVAATRRYRTA